MISDLWRDLLDFHDPGSIVRRAYLERALDERADGVPAAALDYGCGRGRHSFLLAARWPSARVVGLDVDGKALAAARSRAARRGFARLAFTTEGALAATEAAYDVVLCVDVLEHVADDVGALRSIARLTRRGGFLILHTPARAQRRYWGVGAAEAGYAGGEDFGHVREGYEEGDLASLLREAGFVPEGWRRTTAKAAAWLTDLDYRLARWRLHPGRVFTYLASRLAARHEVRHNTSSGRGIMVVARREAAARSPVRPER